MLKISSLSLSINPIKLPPYLNINHDESQSTIAMEINSNDDQNTPLLSNNNQLLAGSIDRNLIQQGISQTFKSAAHLANLLPTGTVMAFQLLSPILTKLGNCDDASRIMSAVLVGLCGLSVLMVSFTDSCKDKDGNLCYGFATKNGLWLIDGRANVPEAMADKYRLRFMDFVHAVMGALVFAAIALFDKNMVKCLFQTPSREIREVLEALPVAIGVVCSMFFVKFPTQRHGIGFPITTT